MKREISKISKEIISIKFKKSYTLSKCLNMFYDVMRKYNIKQGTPTCNDKGEEVGRIVANFEWTICFTLFKSRLIDFIVWQDLIGNIPKDLL
jgi:hypothetical protein